MSAAPAPHRLAFDESASLRKPAEELRARAWAAAASVVDPEMPVLTIDDLGVLRDVAVADDGTVEVAITPTYSGCPAMNVIALEVELALERAGIADARVKTVLSPAWTTDWMSEDGRAQAQRLRHRAAGAEGVAARALRRRDDRLPALRLGGHREARRVRLDRVQGAVALQELPRAVRPFQVHLSVGDPALPPAHDHGDPPETPDAVSIAFAVPDALARGLPLHARPVPDAEDRARRRGAAALLFDLLRASTTASCGSR